MKWKSRGDVGSETSHTSTGTRAWCTLIISRCHSHKGNWLGGGWPPGPGSDNDSYIYTGQASIMLML